MRVVSLWTYLLLRQAINDLRNLMLTAGSRHGEPTATLAHPAGNQKDTVRTSCPTDKLGLDHGVEHTRGYVRVNGEGEIGAEPPAFTTDRRLGAQGVWGAAQECQSPPPPEATRWQPISHEQKTRDPTGAPCCLQPKDQEQVSGPQVSPRTQDAE